MSVISFSAIDGKYAFPRRSLGYMELFSSKHPASNPLWQEFSLEHAPDTRLKLSKNKLESLEERLDGLFSRIEILLESKMYFKASNLLEQILYLTSKIEKHYSYRAAAHFHLGMFYADQGEDKEKAFQHLSEAISLNAGIVQLLPTEKSVGRLLRANLELGRVYNQFGKKRTALKKVHHVIALTRHYADVLSMEQYISFTQSANELGTKVI